MLRLRRRWLGPASEGDRRSRRRPKEQPATRRGSQLGAGRASAQIRPNTGGSPAGGCLARRDLARRSARPPRLSCDLGGLPSAWGGASAQPGPGSASGGKVGWRRGGSGRLVPQEAHPGERGKACLGRLGPGAGSWLGCGPAGAGAGWFGAGSLVASFGVLAQRGSTFGWMARPGGLGPKPKEGTQGRFGRWAKRTEFARFGSGLFFCYFPCYTKHYANNQYTNKP